MSHMILLNNLERVFVNQFRSKPPAGADLAKNPELALMPGETFVIGPGINVIPLDKIARLRAENPIFDNLFKDKIEREKFQEGPTFERLGRPKFEILADKDVDGKTPLAKLKPGVAIKVVRETVDEGLLKGWMKATGLEPLRVEILKQLEFLSTGTRAED